MISTMRKNKRTSYVSKKERSQLEKIQGISVRVTKNEIDINNSSFHFKYKEQNLGLHGIYLTVLLRGIENI